MRHDYTAKQMVYLFTLAEQKGKIHRQKVFAMSTRTTVRNLVRAAMIAAVYAALCLITQPLAFGPVQVRFSEALTLLPVICPGAVAGVTIGCFVSNMLTGSLLDIIAGTLATLLAAMATRKLRHHLWRGLPIASALPPIIINAVVVGFIVTVLYFPPGQPPAVWLFNMLSVGAGQVISCGILGISLVQFIKKSPSLLALFTEQPA